jgi:hypothetical protein
MAQGDQVTTIALAIPHTPWVPERVESFRRLRESLAESGAADHEKVLDERASNKVWPSQMWNWMLSTGADVCLTLQDDALVAPCFWPALRAMLTHLPERAVLGLSAVHPKGPAHARNGSRWYCTQSLLVGWAYALRRFDLAEFVDWTRANPERVRRHNEDDLLNHWVTETGRLTYHPVPTIVDHDTSIASTYKNDAHIHRRATVTWRDYGAGSLTDPDFWLPSGDAPRARNPSEQVCAFCDRRPAVVWARDAGICRECLANSLQAVLLGGHTGWPRTAT